MLFVLNIDELIIIYIILKYQINKQVIRIVLCYPITNEIMFEFFFIFDPFLIRVVLGLGNTTVIDTTREHELSL